MPYQQIPTFKAVPDKIMQMPQPGIGGLNLKDLEFEQEVNQSPYMLNMMYRNGAFSKRFGQEKHSKCDYRIYASIYFGGYIYVHAGNNIYKYDPDTDQYIDVSGGISYPQKKGLFIVFSQKLYYLTSNGFYVLENNSFTYVRPYVPDVYINCKPDGTHRDVADDFNTIGREFKMVYNGEEGVRTYKVYGDEDNIIDWNMPPTIFVNGSLETGFTYNATYKWVEFTTAPGAGNLNVVMTWTLREDLPERAQILNCKYYETYGGANNSRLFLAGGGNSKYFYSNAYDISYFPEYNFATLGNTKEDITGFGRQYNVLIVFKPKEIYSIYSFVETASSTIIEENIGLEGFKSQLVNPRIGCDAPNTIQLINNLLTWFNSNNGVCTLVSTNVQDERNVRVISRNIERTNNFGIKGILDYDFSNNGETLESIQSVDYTNKYFLVFPKSGMCYMWDYEISPYRYSSQGETPPKQLAWYLFDNFYVGEFLKVDKELLYSSSRLNFRNFMIKLNESFADIDYKNAELETSKSIRSYYMTPFLQFGAVESLKNVKNIYVQCRGDTASVIDMYYYTEESLSPEEESDSIRIGGRLWSKFHWSTFQWLTVNYARTFRRKCNLKKVQMASFYFANNEVDRDMSITHLSLQYQIVKYIR